MSTPRHPELEAAIVKEPESPDAFLVYGDWLMEQGEPLGELVSVQAALAMADAAGEVERTRELRAREEALLTENERGWLGHFRRYEHGWRFGFLDRITLSEPGREDCVDVLSLVAARFLRELKVELLGHRAFENGEVVSAIAEVGLPPVLRRLALEPGPRVDARAVDVGSVRSLWGRLARLKELTLRAGNVIYGDIELPSVETVALTTNATEASLGAIARARWPMLTDLSIELTEQASYRYERLNPDLLVPVVVALGSRGRPTPEGTSLPLRRFALNGHFAGDAILSALAEDRELFASAEEINLSRAGVTDASAALLLDRSAQLSRASRIILTGNFLSAAVAKEIEKGLGERVVVGEQTVDWLRADGSEEDDDE